MARVHRADFAGKVRGVQETPQGGVRVPAAVARQGVQTYSDGEGNTWNELRPAEEVFAPASLASFRDAPVTVAHPPGLVTGDTWRGVAVGHVGDDAVSEADRLVTTTLVIQDAATVARVRSGELCETSAGYTCDLDETPGVYDGIPYKRIQRSIVANHVGLGAAGWARGGREMALRMDGADVVVPCGVPATAPGLPTSGSVSAPRNDSAGSPAKDHPMKTLKIKGREYRADAEADMVEAQKKVDEMEGELSASVDKGAEVDAKLEAASKALIEAAQTVAALQVQLAAAKAPADPKPVTEDDVPEAIQDSIVSKRGALLSTARTVLPAEVKLDGLKASEIRAKVVAHTMPTVKLDGLDGKTVEGMYLAVTTRAGEQAQKRTDGNNALASVLLPTSDQSAHVTREDGAAARPSASLQKKLIDQGAQPLNAKVS